MTFHGASESESLCSEKMREREREMIDTLMREREGGREKADVFSPHFLESELPPTGGSERRAPPLCRLSALFVYRQHTADRDSLE